MEYELREDGRHKMIASAEKYGGSNGGGRTTAAEKTLPKRKVGNFS